MQLGGKIKWYSSRSTWSCDAHTNFKNISPAIFE